MAEPSFVNILDGFFVGGTSPIDKRLVLSKEQMKNLNSVDLPMPDVYFAVCSDDDEIYIYNKDNEPNEETGKFMKYKASGSASAVYHPESKQMEFLF